MMLRCKIRPTVKGVALHCDECDYVSIHHFTNKEIKDNTTLQSWCIVCREITQFNLTKEDL